MIKDLKHELHQMADPERAEVYKWFFKTGPGEYGEGDQFIGVMVPKCRKIAKKFRKLHLNQISQLLQSPIHEERLVALIILRHQYESTNDPKIHKEITDFYLNHAKKINNWDLVDSSAHYILGAYLLDKPRKKLYQLARSKNLWERRISMMSTFAFIKANDFDDTLAIAEILLNDKHDLIHKVVGWMLREVGNRNLKTEEDFLKKHYQTMPRTMLRYAIEKFPEPKRKAYLKGEI